MQQHNKIKGMKGIVSLYRDALAYRDMITDTAEQRIRILTFWKKHGDTATKEAYGASRATLYGWQKLLKEGKGKPASLTPKSTAPKRKRTRSIPSAVEALIKEERSHEKVGKEKLAYLIKEDGLGNYSDSTVGRMLVDLKRNGRLPDPVHYSLQGRTGTLIEKKPRKSAKKLRSAGHTGSLAKADTIVRFTNGIKRYILTGIDTETEFAFAYAYTSHSSKTAAGFMDTFKAVAPVTLTHVQTDNGSEFADHFQTYCDTAGIIHFHTYPRCPKMNAEIERFNRTLSEAFISTHRHLLAYDIEEFNRQLMEWLLWYNTRRPHWSIGLIPPLRYICNKVTTEQSNMLWTST